MPTYDYEILDDQGEPTGERFEWIQSMKSETLTKHPETGKPCQRAISVPSIAGTWSPLKEKSQLSNKNLERLGFKANLVTEDAGKYLPPQSPDAILLDAPCTATGTIRRNPDVPYLKTHKNITDLAKVQERLIDHAAEILKPGGTLIYCVCSLEHEEGEDQISNLLDKDKRFSLQPITKSEVPGLSMAIGSRGDLRILPSFWSDFEPGMQGLDGFYIARLIKS